MSDSVADNKVLHVFHKTRKAFVLEYTCGVVLLLLILATKLTGIVLPKLVTYLVILIGFGIILLGEFLRIITTYKLTAGKIMITTGIIKQNKKNVYFHPLAFVPDLNIKQGRVQRLLGYGTVFLQAGPNTTFEIRDVNYPHKVLKIIEESIERNKRIK